MRCLIGDRDFCMPYTTTMVGWETFELEMDECEGTEPPTTTTVNCEGTWSDWSICSSSCGDGTSTKTYTIQIEADGGEECPYNDNETQTGPCNLGECPVNCEGTWSDWSVCSSSCGVGTSTKTYTIQTEADGGEECPYNDNETQTGPCNLGECPDPIKKNTVKRLFTIVPEMVRKTKGIIRRLCGRLQNFFNKAGANYNQNEVTIIENIVEYVDDESAEAFGTMMNFINSLNNRYRENGQPQRDVHNEDVLPPGIMKDLLRVASEKHLVRRKAEMNRLMTRMIDHRDTEGLNYQLSLSENTLEEMTRRSSAAPAHTWLTFTYAQYLELKSKYRDDGTPRF